MRLFLVVQNEGKQKGMKIPATVLPFLVGRDPDCQLRPASAVVSKKHCGFSQEGSQFFLEDFESTNGTFLQGEKVIGKVPIQSGERVQIGPLVFDVLIDAGVVAPAVPAGRVAPSPLKAGSPVGPGMEKPSFANAPTKTIAPSLIPPVSAAKADPVPEVSSRPEDHNALNDDIAALLLGGDGQGTGEYPSSGDGTTIVDLNAETNQPLGGETGQPGQANKPGVGAPPIVNSTDAAKALLDKYMRRSRTGS